ncbi:hypothetical protein PO909_007341, partial [Leuciscus waleckii]
KSNPFDFSFCYRELQIVKTLHRLFAFIPGVISTRHSLHGLVDIVIDLHGQVQGVALALQWKESVMNWCTNICIQILSDKLDSMPVERMRMRPWLEEQINSCKIPGLKWVNKEKRIFQIPWMHAARHGWDVEKDAPLFRNWAIHTGKYQPGDKPDPKTWKANFRCAMNSLPDIEEVKDKSIKKGTNAFRVYKMLSPSERHSKRGKKRAAEKEEKIKAVRSCPEASSWENSNGSSSVTVKQEEDYYSTEADGRDDHLIINDLPDVCQTIEVVTENEDQAVTSSHYPLQISPVSSYGGWLDAYTRIPLAWKHVSATEY